MTATTVAQRLLPGALRAQAPWLLRVSRPALWINTVGTAFVGLWLTGTLFTWRFVPLLLWLTLPFNLLIYGVNDVSDLDTDARNERKGGWQGARIASHDVGSILRWVAALNLPFLLYFAAAYPWEAVAVALLYAGIFIGYSLPPRFKAHPFVDSLSNAAYALPLVLVPVALEASVSWMAAAGLMVWSAAKHSFDAIQDRAEDSAAGLETTPVVLGQSGTLVYCGALWLLSTLCFATLDVTLALLNGVFAAGLLVRMARARTRSAYERVYALSVAFPYVVGGYAGVGLALSLARAQWGH